MPVSPGDLTQFSQVFASSQVAAETSHCAFPGAVRARALELRKSPASPPLRLGQVLRSVQGERPCFRLDDGLSGLASLPRQPAEVKEERRRSIQQAGAGYVLHQPFGPPSRFLARTTGL